MNQILKTKSIFIFDNSYCKTYGLLGNVVLNIWRFKMDFKRGDRNFLHTWILFQSPLILLSQISCVARNIRACCNQTTKTQMSTKNDASKECNGIYAGKSSCQHAKNGNILVTTTHHSLINPPINGHSQWWQALAVGSSTSLALSVMNAKFSQLVFFLITKYGVISCLFFIYAFCIRTGWQTIDRMSKNPFHSPNREISNIFIVAILLQCISYHSCFCCHFMPLLSFWPLIYCCCFSRENQTCFT